jgi:hypothetical protein
LLLAPHSPTHPHRTTHTPPGAGADSSSSNSSDDSDSGSNDEDSVYGTETSRDSSDSEGSTGADDFYLESDEFDSDEDEQATLAQGRQYAQGAEGSASSENGTRRSTRDAGEGGDGDGDEDEDEDEDEPSGEFDGRVAKMADLLKTNARELGGNLTQAYKKLALIHHSDKGGDDEDFKALSAAYQRLKKKWKKKQGVFRVVAFPPYTPTPPRAYTPHTHHYTHTGEGAGGGSSSSSSGSPPHPSPPHTPPPGGW